MRNPISIFKNILFPTNSWKELKKFTNIDPSVILDANSQIKIFSLPTDGSVNVTIGKGSHIFSVFSLVRPHANIVIGQRCQLGQVHFICANNITVGDDVLMAWDITIMDNDSHSLTWEHRSNDVQQGYQDYLHAGNIIEHKDWSHVPIKPIRIGNRVWIGFNVAILKGVTIGDGAVIGAESVVVHDVPAKTIVAGNPARIIRTL